MMIKYPKPIIELRKKISDCEEEIKLHKAVKSAHVVRLRSLEMRHLSEITGNNPLVTLYLGDGLTVATDRGLMRWESAIEAIEGQAAKLGIEPRNDTSLQYAAHYNSERGAYTIGHTNLCLLEDYPISFEFVEAEEDAKDEPGTGWYNADFANVADSQQIEGDTNE